jgi:hypothetical protein
VFYVCEAGYIYSKKGMWIANSVDIKTDIGPIEKPLERLLNLNGVQFKYIGEEKIIKVIGWVL